MNAWLAVARGEFVMQVRRSAFWLFTAIVGGVIMLETFPSRSNLRRLPNLVNHYYAAERVVEQAGELFVIVAMFLVADRTPLDRRLKTADVIMATPVSRPSYLLGKYLGNLAATLLGPGVLVLACTVTQGLFNPTPLSLKPYLLAFLVLGIPAVLKSVRLFYVFFLAYFFYCVFVVERTYAIPFYKLIADAGRLIFVAPGWPVPFSSAYLNLAFLAVAGPAAMLVLLMVMRAGGRAL